jgi:hypothetical protein
MKQRIAEARAEVMSTAILHKAEVRQFVVEFIYEDIIKEGGFRPMSEIYEMYDDLYPMVTEPRRTVGPTVKRNAPNSPIQASVACSTLRLLENLEKRGLMNWHIDDFLRTPVNE